jgi:hypothetical protein
LKGSHLSAATAFCSGGSRPARRMRSMRLWTRACGFPWRPARGR